MQAACCVEGACLALLLLLSSACSWSRNEIWRAGLGQARHTLQLVKSGPCSTVRWYVSVQTALDKQ